MAYLRHYWNGNVVSVYEIKGSVTIGRHPECGIAIDDPTVSGRHAILEGTGRTFGLRDLESTNGVLLKGKKVTRVILESGDIFAIGTHEFEYLYTMPNDLDRTLEIKKSWIPGVYFTK